MCAAGDLLLRCAECAWALAFDQPAARDEVADWLGGWAVAAATSGVAGRVRFQSADAPGQQGLGARAAAGGQLQVHLAGFSILLSAAAGRSRLGLAPPSLLFADAGGTVQYRPGEAAAAAQALLRLLLLRGALTAGGLALHASAVRSSGRALVFAGASGCGKSTAARMFLTADWLDDDTVVLLERGGRWRRPNVPDVRRPSRFGPADMGELTLAAVIVPRKAPGFEARVLAGAEALKACLHAPPPALAEWCGVSAQQLLSRVNSLISSVSVLEVGWALADDLAARLAGLLESAAPAG